MQDLFDDFIIPLVIHDFIYHIVKGLSSLKCNKMVTVCAGDPRTAWLDAARGLASLYQD